MRPMAPPRALKQFLDLAMEHLIGRGAAVPVANVPLAIYDYGGAQAQDLIQLHQPLVGVGGPQHIIRPQALPELPPFLQRTEWRDVDGNYLDPLLTKLPLQAPQGWSLQPAGGSTGKGEVEDHYVSLMFGQGKCATHTGANGEVGCHRSTWLGV